MPKQHQRTPSEKLLFITDHNLGKLAKWLRLIGYDTAYHDGKTGRDLWDRALRENRIVLTRRKNLHDYPQEIKTVVVEGERVEDQLLFLRDRLGLEQDEDRTLKICSLCNSRLQDVDKKTLQDRVPPYVLEINDVFYECPVCLRVYWPGSHVGHMQEMLRRHSRKDRP